MKIQPRVGTGLFLGLALGVTLTLGHGVLAKREQPSPVPLEELRTFTDVYTRIKNDYVVEVEDKVLHGLKFSLEYYLTARAWHC